MSKPSGFSWQSMSSVIYIEVSLTSVSIKPPWMLLKRAHSQSLHGSLRLQTWRLRNPYLSHSSTTTGDWGHRMRCLYQSQDPQWYPIKEQGALDQKWVSVLNKSGSTAVIEDCDVLVRCRPVFVTAVVCLMLFDFFEGSIWKTWKEKKNRWHFKNIYSQWCYLKVSIIYTLSYNPRHFLYFSKVYIQKYFLFILRFRRRNGIRERARSLF